MTGQGSKAHQRLIWGLAMLAACPGGAGPVTKDVRPGIEVLVTDSIHLVVRRRLGLVTNQSGVDRHGVSDVERLTGAGLTLVALFSPEHGFRGTADPGAAVTTSRDSATGLPIYSLYGATSSPTDSMLSGIDVLLVDLQDAGARYYTYLYTTVGVMRAASRRGIPVIVLDRPNPIGGAVQGDVLDTTFRSPVGYLAMPMRHGMTLGELALLARSDLGLAVDLTVVPVSGWQRTMYYDATGLPFIAPSPNLRSLEALLHYPGTCLFEGTNLSVGRGTDHAFEQVGAPGLDTARVLAALRDSAPPGVTFQGTAFTPHAPGDGKYSDTTVTGIRLTVTDRDRYDPTRTALTLLHSLRATGFPLVILHGQFDRLAADRDLIGAADGRAAALDWSPGLARFRERRRPFLIYPE